MIRREPMSATPSPPLPDGERELAALDDASVEGIGEGRFSVTNRSVRFVETSGLAKKALHALGTSSTPGPSHDIGRDEIVAVAIESTMLGFKKLRLRLRDGTDWVVQIGMRDPSPLAVALRTRAER